MAGETSTSVDRSTSDGMLGRLRNALEGPNTLGQGRPFWLGFTVLVGLLLVYPMFRSSYYVSNTAYLLVSAFLGLSLCLVWGYTGIFSFGQVAFYGIAGYTFGIVSINLTGPVGTMAGLLVGIAVSGAFAFLVGYFMFYGGVSDVYVAIITLAVALVFLFIAPSWRHLALPVAGTGVGLLLNRLVYGVLRPLPAYRRAQVHDRAT